MPAPISRGSVFIGHGLEMASASRVGLVVHSKRVPLLPNALEYGGMGLFPAGAYSNRQYYSCRVEVDPTVPPLLIDLFYDPQTSGGLLVSLPQDQTEKMVESLRKDGHADASIIGEVVEEHPGKMMIK